MIIRPLILILGTIPVMKESGLAVGLVWLIAISLFFSD